MRILVTGAGGMVGKAVSEFCRLNGDEVFSYDHAHLDIGSSELVSSTIKRVNPDVVINCAAWTDVDGCESDRARAFAANARGPENLAKAGHEIDAKLITISTDYVFDGRKQGFYTQADEPSPESVYGVAKLEGEKLALAANPKTIVVRTGFVFGAGGKNFLSTIIDRAKSGAKLKAISDAYGTPTYASDLAVRLRELAEADFGQVVKLELPKIFHVVNSGPGVSYEEFARAALELSGFASLPLETVAMNSLNRPAPRPQNSRLKCLVSPAIGLEPLRSWREALRAFAALETHVQGVSP